MHFSRIEVSKMPPILLLEETSRREPIEIDQRGESSKNIKLQHESCSVIAASAVRSLAVPGRELQRGARHWHVDSMSRMLGNRTCRDTIKYYMVAIRHNGRTAKSLPLPDYQSLAELRYQIRRFTHFSERAVRRAGLEPRQHQLMLALKTLPKDVRPRIGALAERLLIQHHSAVELVNRLAAGGYVRRDRADADRREVFVSLTPKGEKVLRELSLHHRAELQTQGPALIVALKRAIRTARTG